MSKIQIGAGGRPIPGFINIDSEVESSNVQLGEAKDLSPFAKESSVDIIFTNAVFEHFYPQEHKAILREWKRVLTDDGHIVCLGIPDFEMIAKLYFDKAMSLGNISRYFQGEISYKNPTLAQFHKALFDMDTLQQIFTSVGFNAFVFRYRYPFEDNPVNLGILASKDFVSVYTLYDIPTIEKYIMIDTMEGK